MSYYHLGELISEQAQKHKKRTAIKYQQGTDWVDMSWQKFHDRVMKTAQAMAELGVIPGDNIGIYSQNMEKYLITEFAAYGSLQDLMKKRPNREDIDDKSEAKTNFPLTIP